MNSINGEQPEKNYEDLDNLEAIKKIKELVKKTNICFFNTLVKSDQLVSTRPMAVQKIDDEGNLWFLSANDSYKNLHVEIDNVVLLLFQGSSYSDFLSLFGIATISIDKEKIKDLWEPILKAWFTEGIDDPVSLLLKLNQRRAIIGTINMAM